MITDKDREWSYPSNQDISDAMRIVDLMHDSEKPGYFVLSDELSKIRNESADQARKEAAEMAVEFIRDQGMEQMEMWGEYDDNRLRAAILGETVKEGKTSPDAFDVALRVLAFNPSVPNATGKLADMIEQYAEDYCAEKLAIAVKALEYVVCLDVNPATTALSSSEIVALGSNVARSALKEIQ